MAIGNLTKCEGTSLPLPGITNGHADTNLYFLSASSTLSLPYVLQIRPRILRFAGKYTTQFHYICKVYIDLISLLNTIVHATFARKSQERGHLTRQTFTAWS